MKMGSCVRASASAMLRGVLATALMATSALAFATDGIAQLRSQLAVIEGDKKKLAERMESARDRLERLAQQRKLRMTALGSSASVRPRFSVSNGAALTPPRRSEKAIPTPSVPESRKDRNKAAP